MLLVLPGGARAQALLEYRYQYDAIGQPTAVTDGAGQTARTAYDPLGRPTAETDPLNHSATYRYQANDALTRVQAPNGAVTAWTVDGFGQATGETGPDRGAVAYRHDAAGNLTRRTDARGARIDTAYDALDRPTERRVYRPDGTLEATHLYAWDRPPRGIGRLGEIDAGPNRLAFDYDLAGHVTARVYARAGVTLAARADHDPVTGLPDTLTYPSGGVIQYRHDAAGRISGLTWDGQPVADQLQYTASGAVSALRLANGLTHQRTYDTAGRLKSYTLANDLYRLAYDAAGRLITLTPPDPNGQQRFSYDAAGRLTGYQGPAHGESYTYDPNGNRLARTRNGQTTAYGYLPASNRLQSVDAAPVGHDAAGNLARDPARQYTHDSAGRLIQLAHGATLARYEYNGLGERVLKQIGTELRHFVYGEDGQLLGEYDSAGRPLAEYAWLGGLPVAYRLHRTVDGLARTELYAVEADHLGTPRALTDAAQRLRWRWTSAPFGDTPPDENPEGLGSITFNLRFPGQYFDEESGLHYNTFRDYDPQTGRYVQSDPIGLAGGINTYLYAEGNPLYYYDPLGLCPPDVFAWCQKLCESEGKLIEWCGIVPVTPFTSERRCYCDQNCKIDSYENPGHHDPTNSGPNKYNPTKEPLPKNHQDLWKNSLPDPRPDEASNTRWTLEDPGKNANFHRFQNDGNGNWHWNGSTNGGTTGAGEFRRIEKTPQGLSRLWR